MACGERRAYKRNLTIYDIIFLKILGNVTTLDLDDFLLESEFHESLIIIERY